MQPITRVSCRSAVPRRSPISALALAERLDAAEARLLELAALPPSADETDADAETGERWHENQVWAHLAEFPGYWIGQIERIVVVASGEAPQFGRTKADDARLAAIDAGNREPRAALVLRATNGIATARSFLARLDAAAWSRTGRHPTLGVMDVTTIVERFLVGHLEEHVAQLESLRSAAAPR
jgi:hypothetical protein